MAQNAQLARLGVTGLVMVAPVGTTVPTDFAAWGTGWTELGYLSDDGLEEGLDEDNQEFVPWQSKTPIRVEITKSTRTFHFTCWETNLQTVSLYYRVPVADMTTTGSAPNQVVSFNETATPTRDMRAFGFDVVDGAYQRRIIVPLAEVTERGDLTYKSDELIGYDITISAYPGSDGVSVKRLHKEGWATTP